jgi:shikimate dehydrogenase
MNNKYGLIGRKLSHSFSPQIHNIIFKELHLEGSYNIFETEEENLEHLLSSFKSNDTKGVNVTIPYKTVIMKYLDTISSEGQKIGAINTIKFKDKILEGYNTDYIGFGASLKSSNIVIKNKTAVILGTGGASKAVTQYLIDNEINDICFISRNPTGILPNTADIKILSYDELTNKKDGDIIINCTPCGMYPNVKACPVNKNVISRYSIAIDLIYNPMETIFLKYAKELGLKTINGLYMLVAQATASQEIWQSKKFEQKLVDEIYNKVKKSLYL